MSEEDNEFDDDADSFETLERYDTGHRYQIHMMNMTTKCDTAPLTGAMPKVWGWVAMAKYNGTETFANQKVDVWQSMTKYATLRLAVLSSDTTTPVYQTRIDNNHMTTTYQFTSWSPMAPNSTVFAVPASCSTIQIVPI
jgi:hypothetical protein